MIELYIYTVLYTLPIQYNNFSAFIYTLLLCSLCAHTAVSSRLHRVYRVCTEHVHTVQQWYLLSCMYAVIYNNVLRTVYCVLVTATEYTQSTIYNSMIPVTATVCTIYYSTVF